jgi:hypothetical protein
MVASKDAPPVTPWTPIERQLIESSVWEADPVVCKLWVTMLIIASEPGRNGEIDMTVRLLAARAVLPVESTIAALATLSAPDPGSRSREEAGRRIVPLDPGRDWGWRLVTWARRKDARTRAMAAVRQQRKRAGGSVAARDTVTPRHDESRTVTPRHKKFDNRRTIGEREEREGAPLSQASHLTGEPTAEEWRARAKREHPDWPESDVKRSLRMAPNVKLWPKGWESRQDTLHERYVDHAKDLAKTPSPLDREKAATRRTIERAIAAAEGRNGNVTETRERLRERT